VKTFVNFTMLKSGTHYLREIIFNLTKKNFIEPQIETGRNNYEDQNKFFVPTDKNRFYSWHLFPYDKTISFLQKNKIKTICLVRNIFDQTYSIYNHFKFNVDHEINRGRNVQDIFESISRRDGINTIINGINTKKFTWKGVTHQLKHLETLYYLKKNTDVFLITYEELTFRKKKTIQELIDFLGLVITQNEINKIIDSTNIQNMQKIKKNKSHFLNIEKKHSLDFFENEHFKNIESIIDGKYNVLKKCLEKEGCGYLVNKEQLITFNKKFRN